MRVEEEEEKERKKRTLKKENTAAKLVTCSHMRIIMDERERVFPDV